MLDERNRQPELTARLTGAANERFKRSFSSWFWGSITAATTLHFAIFAFLPSMAVAVAGPDVTTTEVINIPPEVDVPPPPEALRRPARPVINPVALDDDLTIPHNTIVDQIPNLLPPRPKAADTTLAEWPRFVVTTVKPKLLNLEEVNRVLEREYPALLKDAGIGDTTRVHLFVDEGGIVRNQLVDVSSGHAGLDNAALKVVTVARFSPAQNRDKTVAVWVSMAITFEAN